MSSREAFSRSTTPILGPPKGRAGRPPTGQPRRAAPCPGSAVARSPRSPRAGRRRRARPRRCARGAMGCRSAPGIFGTAAPAQSARCGARWQTPTSSRTRAWGVSTPRAASTACATSCARWSRTASLPSTSTRRSSCCRASRESARTTAWRSARRTGAGQSLLGRLSAQGRACSTRVRRGRTPPLSPRGRAPCRTNTAIIAGTRPGRRAE
mmetsp:Transcript_14762/g.47073  ORF Transcript_14762/g.47073 Transcript_14762/m.47073 type:complete len:210 (+) Transcript_14762:209-838(+)